MKGLTRALKIVFSFSGIVVLIALAMPWIGPFKKGATALMSFDWYFAVVEVLLVIALLGLLATLLRALFARPDKNVLVTTVDGGQISVSRDAIASQAAHIVESDGTLKCQRVFVEEKHGSVNVAVRVLPRETIDVVARGGQLHDDLVTGLAAVCGDKVGTVSIDFATPKAAVDVRPEAELTAEGEAYYDEHPEDLAGYNPPLESHSPQALPDPVAETAEAAASHTSEITIPMGE